MTSTSPFIQQFDELPNTLRIFPLSNAVILPGTRLPLNIFEPRYLNMVRDAMRSDQLIGMVQPKKDDSSEELFEVGCAGRISTYEERSDGRIDLILTGVCRFQIGEELAVTTGYRMIAPQWSKYAADYQAAATAGASAVAEFKSNLRIYLKIKSIQADWAVLDALAIDDLANSLLSYLPLSVADKQMLLEANSFPDRLAIFTAIIESDGANTITH